MSLNLASSMVRVRSAGTYSGGFETGVLFAGCPCHGVRNHVLRGARQYLACCALNTLTTPFIIDAFFIFHLYPMLRAFRRRRNKIVKRGLSALVFSLYVCVLVPYLFIYLFSGLRFFPPRFLCLLRDKVEQEKPATEQYNNRIPHFCFPRSELRPLVSSR